MVKFFSLAFAGLALVSANTAGAEEIDWKQVDAALGKTGAVSGEIHRYGFPRTDLDVTLDGVTIKPAFALGGWVAFVPAHGGVMIMGDLVLLETEINPVMKKLIDSGLSITAIHNHLLRASPATFYMHVGGQGDPVKIATALRAALAESKTPFNPPPAAAASPPAIDLDTAKLDETIGVKGRANGGVYQFVVPRRDPVTEMGMTLPPGSDRSCNRHQLPADRRRQGRDHRRFRVDGRGGESRDPRVSGKRHRCDRNPQPHAGRTAAVVLRAFLGE